MTDYAADDVGTIRRRMAEIKVAEGRQLDALDVEILSGAELTQYSVSRGLPRSYCESDADLRKRLTLLDMVPEDITRGEVLVEWVSVQCQRALHEAITSVA